MLQRNSKCQPHKNFTKKKRLSQEELANECMDLHYPVSVSSIKRAEIGKKISYRTARNLSRCFNMPLDELIISEDQHNQDLASDAFDELLNAKNYTGTPDIFPDKMLEFLDTVETRIYWKKALTLSGNLERKVINVLCHELLKTYICTSDEEIKNSFTHRLKQSE